MIFHSLDFDPVGFYSLVVWKIDDHPLLRGHDDQPHIDGLVAHVMFTATREDPGKPAVYLIGNSSDPLYIGKTDTAGAAVGDRLGWYASRPEFLRPNGRRRTFKVDGDTRNRVLLIEQLILRAAAGRPAQIDAWIHFLDKIPNQKVALDAEKGIRRAGRWNCTPPAKVLAATRLRIRDLMVANRGLIAGMLG